MARRKILYVAHNHPEVRPGGAEEYAFELYRAMRDLAEFEPLFLARTGPPVSVTGRYHEGTLLTTVNDDPNQYFFYTDTLDYDWLFGTPRNKRVLTRFLRDFLEAQQPELVHFQHTLFFGYDAVRVVRNTLPNAPIVYTLHEFLPICHRNGQLLRTMSNKPCMQESPRRCHECFPEISPQTFFFRKRFIQSQLSLVDLFLAPSRFLLERYVEWGIPREKIRFEDYGRLPRPHIAPSERRERNRLAFFGQLSFYKGVNVLLRAIELLRRSGVEPDLRLHGANLELQPDDFRSDFELLLEATKGIVRLEGPYDRDDLGALMEECDWVVVPSVWWENSPLVIQEAFLHGRPVICSDIGGMAEKVTDGVNGLHFRAGDADSLARTLQKAVGTPGLWDELRNGIPGIHPMDQHLQFLTGGYRSLLDEKAERVGSDNGAARAGAGSRS